MNNRLQSSISLLITQQLFPDLIQMEVTIDNDDIVLTGTTGKYANKVAAGEIARKNGRNKHIINKLEVIPIKGISDKEIIYLITERYRKNFGDFYRNIDVEVRDGRVRLHGQLKWKYQQQLATDCIIEVPGILDIENNIAIPPLKKQITIEEIVMALKKEESIKIENIQVEITGHKVSLKGMVDSEAQIVLATKVIHAVPGVLEIENYLCVS